MVSSELLEVMNVPNRIAVVYNGRIVKEFERGETSEEEVLSYALGLGAKVKGTPWKKIGHEFGTGTSCAHTGSSSPSS